MKITVQKCLKLIRELAEAGEPITSQAFVDHFDIQPTKLSKALDIGAGWVSNLRRWGLIRRAPGRLKVDGPQRKLQVYEITEWGRKYKVQGVKKVKSTLRIAANPPQDRG
jgi:hypothetical protein